MTNKFEEVSLWYYDTKRLYIELEQLKYLKSCEKSLNDHLNEKLKYEF